MNRSLAYVGVGMILGGVALIAWPIAVTGRELLDYEQIAGFLLAPVGLVVVLIAAASFDPRRTTVHGAFGGDHDDPRVPTLAASSLVLPAVLANPKAPVHCRYCRTVITYELARCPRCSRDRPCRACGRPLVTVQEHATCPACMRAELFCNCSTADAPRQRRSAPRPRRRR